MDSNVYLEEMKKIQANLLDYLDNDNNIEEKYQNLKNKFKDINIHGNKYKINSLMHLLLHISNDHHRVESFFSKIGQIIIFFKNELKKHLSNSELFCIFRSNKRILLLLVEEKIMKFDEFIVKKIIKGKFLGNKYPQYFQPEIEPFIKEKWFPRHDKSDFRLSDNSFVEDITKKLPNDFFEKRKIGENDDVICNFIRKDLIEEFIIYVNKNLYSLKSKISQSIYETSNFLLKKDKIDLIEYAAFFGSIQIFRFLISNKVELTPSLWLYAIHGEDPEIIKTLEESKLKLPKNESYELMLKESIKCQHVGVSNYILDNYLSDKKENLDDYLLINCLKYYNFILIENDKINETTFSYLCKYDHYAFVSFLLNTMDIDINHKTISKINSFFNSIFKLKKNQWSLYNTFIKQHYI